MFIVNDTDLLITKYNSNSNTITYNILMAPYTSMVINVHKDGIDYFKAIYEILPDGRPGRTQEIVTDLVKINPCEFFIRLKNDFTNYEYYYNLLIDYITEDLESF